MTLITRQTPKSARRTVTHCIQLADTHSVHEQSSAGALRDLLPHLLLVIPDIWIYEAVIRAVNGVQVAAV